MTDAAAVRPASTVLLLRDGTAGEIEVFMMVRRHQIEFNSGALVFPGGSVDPGDHDIAGSRQRYDGGETLDAQALAFRIAAIRETFEESGILLARPRQSGDMVSAASAAEMGAAFRDGSGKEGIFLGLLTDRGVRLALDALVPFAHW